MSGPRTLVVGCGSIGQRHIRNLRALQVDEILAYDSRSDHLGAVAQQLGVRACANVTEGLDAHPDVVFVCTPPHLHTRYLVESLEANAHVFVEKPLSNSPEGLSNVLGEARRRSRVVYVGYNLRFHPGIRQARELLLQGAIGRLFVMRAEFGQYLPDWRPAQDYRSVYTAHSSMGGGIILDASHEIDYVRWLGGEPERVYCASGHLSRLSMDVEDTAVITLHLVGGVLAEIHLDCLQRVYARNCKLVGEEGTITWDAREGLRLWNNASNGWQEFSISSDSNETYLEEVRHFLRCVSGEALPEVDGATGLRVLEIALAAKQSSELGTEVPV